MGVKKSDNKTPDYIPSVDETKWYSYCVKNNIRISYKPETTGSSPKCWYITIIIGPYKKGEKVNVSPDCYKAGECHEQMYKTCEYYYEKYRN